MGQPAEAVERRIRAVFDDGDLPGAATAAIEGYGPEILGFLHALARDEALACDAFSMFCEDLWRGLERFGWRSSFRTWSYTLARNALHRLRRDPGRRHVPLDARVANIADPVRTSTLSHLKTERKDELARLRQALDEDDRTLLILRLDRGMSWNEVAQVMSDGSTGPTAAALRKRFERVKRRIARELRPAAPER